MKLVFSFDVACLGGMERQRTGANAIETIMKSAVFSLLIGVALLIAGIRSRMADERRGMLLTPLTSTTISSYVDSSARWETASQLPGCAAKPALESEPSAEGRA